MNDKIVTRKICVMHCMFGEPGEIVYDLIESFGYAVDDSILNRVGLIPVQRSLNKIIWMLPNVTFVQSASESL